MHGFIFFILKLIRFTITIEMVELHLVDARISDNRLAACYYYLLFNFVDREIDPEKRTEEELGSGRISNLSV